MRGKKGGGKRSTVSEGEGIESKGELSGRHEDEERQRETEREYRLGARDLESEFLDFNVLSTRQRGIEGEGGS